MRDKRFVAVHRGGPLTREYHNQLIRWAVECSEHVLSLVTQDLDQRLINALHIAKEWAKENTTVGEARKASVAAIAVANESSNPLITAIARSIGHAVATAHMADHSIRAAEYALKAVKISGKSIDEERKWQENKLTSDISELIITARQNKHLRI